MLILHYHPFSSYCQKVLVALYEREVPFERNIVDLGNPEQKAALERLWPMGKFPVLRDERRGITVPESSLIVEYLDRVHPAPPPLVPADPGAALDAHLWDRFFDHYVSVPMQKIVTDRIRPPGFNGPHGVGEARAMLDQAYPMINRQLAGKLWATGEHFTMADCAALPALFFASIVHPFPLELRELDAYLDRLFERPSVQRVISEAQPYFSMFPYLDAMPARYLEAAS